MSYTTRCVKLCVSVFLQLGSVCFPRQIIIRPGIEIGLLRVNQARPPGIEGGVLRVNQAARH